MAVPHQTLAAISARQIAVSRKNAGPPGVHCLRQKPARAIAHKIDQRVGKVLRWRKATTVSSGMAYQILLGSVAQHRHDAASVIPRRQSFAFSVMFQLRAASSMRSS